jgi:hypothetical protein
MEKHRTDAATAARIELPRTAIDDISDFGPELDEGQLRLVDGGMPVVTKL